MSQLAIFLLGSPRLELDGEPVEVERRKAIALMAYLVVTDYSHSRDVLATLLWPEYDQTRARAALRRTLSVLNKASTGIGLDVDRETIGLKQDPKLWVDLQQFHQRLAACRRHAHPDTEVCAACLPLLTEAVTLYRDDFLAGFTLRDSPPFDEWQFFQTENLRRELAGALEKLVQGHTAQAEYEPAIAYARRWLGLDPLHEPAHRQLMQLYAWTDQHAAAMRQYQECAQILEKELGISPSAETEALYEQIRARRLSRAPLEPERTQAGEQTNRGDFVTRPSPLPPFLSSAPLPPSPPAFFVAREQELAQLNRYLETMLADQGQVVFITGEAGSGKTALIREFARRAQDSFADLVVANGNCNAHTGIGDPYLPFREMLGLLTGDIEAGWLRGTITQENAHRLWTLLPLSIQALLKLGPDLIDSFVSSTALATRAAGLSLDQTDELDRLKQLGQRQSVGNDADGVAQSDLFEQFTDVLQFLTRQHPLLLIIDDAQWADTASLGLLFHLSRRLAGSRILMVIVYRPHDIALGRPSTHATATGPVERHPLESVVNEIRRAYGDIEIDLDQAMDRHFVEAFLDVEPNQLGPEFRTALYHQTQGHPLFTVELLREMQERGDIIRDEQGRWIEGLTLNWGTLPARVEAVIEERIARLAENLRDILAVASVEGERFTAQVIARVQQTQERQLLRVLSQELEKRHQLVQEQGEIQVNGHFLSRYQFAHTLFQQYLYNTLSAGERRLLHGEIAVALEEAYEGRIEKVTVQLAHHYAEAGQIEKAVDYLLQAGDRARYLYAHQEAIDFYQQALTFLKEQRAYERAARTLMKLGLTYHLAFNFQQAREAYGEGFALWQQAGTGQPTPLPPAPHALRTTWYNPPTLDPTMAMDDVSGGLINQIFSGLVTLTPELDVIPEVAQSWEVLEEGRQYIFHLRDDVRWSDGLPVTAEDFVYAWKRVLNPATASPNAIYLFDVKGARAFHQGEISDPDQVAIQALDPVTLRVELVKPTSYFPQLLTLWVVYPLPRHVVARHGEAWTEPDHIVTNGPFKLTQWQPGRLMVLERNPDYRGQATGNVQQVVLHLNVASSAETLEMYETDRLDVVRIFVLSEMDRIRRQRAAEYLSVPQLYTQYVGFNVRQPPFNDPRVRRAFVLACDKETLASVTLSGYYFPASGGFIPPEMPGHSPGIGLPYDPEQARYLLAEAGYPGGRNFPVVEALTKPKHTLECNYISQQWRENLGVEIKWQIIEWGMLLDRLNRAPPPLFRMGWSPDYPDPDNLLRMGVHTEDWLGWQNETYMGLLQKARRTTNQAERMELYQQADKILVEEAAIMPLLHGRQHLLIKPWVSKLPTSAIKWNFWNDVIIEPH